MIRRARGLHLSKSGWLHGNINGPQRHSLNIENRPAFIWQQFADSESTIVENEPTAEDVNPQRSPNVQWIESPEGGVIFPFHPSWQHPSRHEPGLLFAAHLETALLQLRREVEEGAEGESESGRHRAPSLGPILLDAYRAADRVLQLSGTPEHEIAKRVRILPSVPTVTSFHDAVPISVLDASVMKACLLGLANQSPCTLELLRTRVPEATQGQLERILHRCCQLGLACSRGSDGYFMEGMPGSFPTLTLAFVLGADLTFCLRRCATQEYQVQAFFELLRAVHVLDSGAIGRQDELPKPKDGMPDLTVLAVPVATRWPLSPPSGGLGGAGHGGGGDGVGVDCASLSHCEGGEQSWNFDVAVLVRSTSMAQGDCTDATAAPGWLAVRALATFTPSAEVLTLSYAVQGAHTAIPGLLRTIWLATSRSLMCVAHSETIFSLPARGGSLCVLLWVLAPTCRAFLRFWQWATALDAALGRTMPVSGEQILLPPDTVPVRQTVTPPPEVLNADLKEGGGVIARLMTVMGSTGLVYASSVAGSAVAQVIAVCSTGKSGSNGSCGVSCGSRPPQSGEPPRVVLCRFMPAQMLALRLWMPSRNASLPPEARTVLLQMELGGDEQEQQRAGRVFAERVQCALEWPSPNIRPSIPPPPSNEAERALVGMARDAFGSLHMIGPFAFKRLLLILEMQSCDAGRGYSRCVRVLFEHQSTVLQPPPIPAAVGAAELAEGQAAMLVRFNMAATSASGRGIPTVRQELSQLAADVPLRLGGASPASLGRLLRSHSSYEFLPPAEMLDSLAHLALVPLLVGESGDTGTDPLANGGPSGTGGPEDPAGATPSGATGGLLVYPSTFKTSQTECSFCGKELLERGPKWKPFLSTCAIVYIIDIHKECSGCGKPYIAKDFRDTCGVVLAHEVAYNQEIQVRVAYESCRHHTSWCESCVSLTLAVRKHIQAAFRVAMENKNESALAFAQRRRDETLAVQYGSKDTYEALLDFPQGVRLAIEQALSRALLNGLVSYLHTLMAKVSCLTCSAVPLAEVADGDLNRLIQVFGKPNIDAQQAMPSVWASDQSDHEEGGGSTSSGSFVSVGDDVTQLLVACADFEAKARAEVAASAGSIGPDAQTAVDGILLDGGLTTAVAAAALEASSRTQRARISGSGAWAGAHPGGDLAWEHKYQHGFLEFVVAHDYGTLPTVVRVVYQMRQTPPQVLNAARATEYRIAGEYAKSLFGVGGRKESAYAADEDVLGFSCWAMSECIGVGHGAGGGPECSFRELDDTVQRECIKRLRSYLSEGRQKTAERLAQAGREEVINYVETMQRKCLEGRRDSCHSEYEPLMAQIAAFANAHKLVDHGELTSRCTCRPDKKLGNYFKTLGSGNARLVSMRFSDGMEGLNYYTDSIGGFRRGRAMMHISDIACKLAVRPHLARLFVEPASPTPLCLPDGTGEPC